MDERRIKLESCTKEELIDTIEILRNVYSKQVKLIEELENKNKELNDKLKKLWHRI